MARPYGATNLRLTKQRRREVIRDLQRASSEGDVLASVALLLVDTFKENAKRTEVS